MLPVVVLLSALGTQFRVVAHAEPDEIRPGDGAVLVTPPGQVEIVMSEALARSEGGSDIDVFDAEGTEVTTEPAELDLTDRRRLTVPIPADLAPGTYTVRWTSLSDEDGDPASGVLTFTFDPQGVANPGREALDEDISAPSPPTDTGDNLSAVANGRSTRNGWVTAAASGLVGAAIGGMAVFLLSKRPT